MTVFIVLLILSLSLAAQYVAGVIKPPLLAKTLASLAFVALGAYSLFAPGGIGPLSTQIGWHLSHPFYVRLFCGLVAGALGDVLLELFDSKNKLFFLGVGAFFIGHVLYVAAFSYIDHSAAWIALLCAFPVAAVLTVLSARLLTFEGPRRLILLCYMFALSFMCAYAWTILIRGGNTPFLLIAPGATLFLVSDTTLGLQLFAGDRLAQHRRLLGTICLITYYLAQNLIAVSVSI